MAGDAARTAADEAVASRVGHQPAAHALGGAPRATSGASSTTCAGRAGRGRGSTTWPSARRGSSSSRPRSGPEDVDVVDGVLRQDGRRGSQARCTMPRTLPRPWRALLPEEPERRCCRCSASWPRSPSSDGRARPWSAPPQNLRRMLTSRPRLLDEGAVDEAGRALGLALQSSGHRRRATAGVRPRGAGAGRTGVQRGTGRTAGPRSAICVVLVWTCVRLDVLSTVGRAEQRGDQRAPHPDRADRELGHRPADTGPPGARGDRRPSRPGALDDRERRAGAGLRARRRPDDRAQRRRGAVDLLPGHHGPAARRGRQDAPAQPAGPVDRSGQRCCPPRSACPPGGTTRGYVVFELPGGARSRPSSSPWDRGSRRRPAGRSVSRVTTGACSVRIRLRRDAQFGV